MEARLVLLLALAGGVVLAVLLGRHWAGARTRRMASSSEPLWAALGLSPGCLPTVVAFSTPGCAACRTAQAPALDALERLLGPGSVRVVRVDAAARPHVARAFGVLTVPTTVVLAANGQLLKQNHGFTPTDRLLGQLHRARP